MRSGQSGFPTWSHSTILLAMVTPFNLLTHPLPKPLSRESLVQRWCPIRSLDRCGNTTNKHQRPRPKGNPSCEQASNGSDCVVKALQLGRHAISLANLNFTQPTPPSSSTRKAFKNGQAQKSFDRRSSPRSIPMNAIAASLYHPAVPVWLGWSRTS